MVFSLKTFVETTNVNYDSLNRCGRKISHRRCKRWGCSTFQRHSERLSVKEIKYNICSTLKDPFASGIEMKLCPNIFLCHSLFCYRRVWKPSPRISVCHYFPAKIHWATIFIGKSIESSIHNNSSDRSLYTHAHTLTSLTHSVSSVNHPHANTCWQTHFIHYDDTLLSYDVIHLYKDLYLFFFSPSDTQQSLAIKTEQWISDRIYKVRTELWKNRAIVSK